MFTLKYNGLLIAALAASIVALSVASHADDLDIYAGTLVRKSATPELIFAIDTSTTMNCALQQSIVTDNFKCFLNSHPELLDTSPLVSLLGLQDYTVPDDVKIKLVRSVMARVLGDDSILPADVKVGLAFYNDPGASVVQPLKPLGAATGYEAYPEHRDLLMAEMASVLPQGQTPILGTLLEVGQYLTSAQVISGKRRMPRTDVLSTATKNGLLHTDYDGGLWQTQAKPYGVTSRISSTETVQAETLNYSASAECRAAITADVVAGRADHRCMFERLGSASDRVRYNEDINRASVCDSHETLAAETSTTQVVLLSGGLASGEDMSFLLEGASMATWVKRFVTGDENASGELAAGAFSSALGGLSAEEAFTDLGCVTSAHSSARGDNVELRRQQYNSCLFNVAHRFRELGVKVNVIGFDVDDAGFAVNNNILKKIADITGGEFRATSDVDDLESFIANLSSGSLPAYRLAVALSPAVAVNPGSIVTNSGEVYVPGFEPGDTRLFYGNLKKFRLEERPTSSGTEGQGHGYETVLVGANNRIATETCSIDEEIYTCFKDSVRDLWATAQPTTEGAPRPDYSAVTVGGAAAQQGVYGPYPDGARRVFLQNGRGPQDLSLLDLVAGGQDPDYGSPDQSALPVTDGNVSLATKNHYARLISHADQPGTSFESFRDLAAYLKNGDPDLLNLDFAYDLMRWLNGFDQQRFTTDGVFSTDGTLRERDLLGGNAPFTDNSSDLDKSRLYYGAIVHSTPTVVNYGFTVNGDGSVNFDNTLYVGGNDGFLRAVNADDGSEYFSFFPETLISRLPGWYRRSIGKMQYGMDSPWTPWRQDMPDSQGVVDGQITANQDFVRLYGGMRRGGHSVFFLDVTDRTAPRLLKEISPQEPGFERLGQTWSQPVLARVKKPGQSLPTVVAIFGGGYDPDYDPDAAVGGDSRCLDTPEQAILCGNQIYIVEAGGYTGQPADENAIGDILWWASNTGTARNYSPAATMHSVVANMNHSIPGKVKTLDIDDDGYVDRIYVGDLGGQVFRISINNRIDDARDSAGEFITIGTLAQVGNEGAATQLVANNRMFFESPSVAVMDNNNQRYIGVGIASGWRANPADKNTDDEIYFFRDTLAGTQPVIRRPEDGVSTDQFKLDVQDYQGTITALDSFKALAASLNAEGEGGRKAFGSPLILRGNLFLPVYIPPTDAELQTSVTACAPPPHRSTVVGLRVQSEGLDLVVNNQGNIVPATGADGTPMAFFQSDPVRSVPFNGLGVHVGDNSVSILAGTQAITLSLPDEAVRKTRWELLDSGRAAIPASAVSGNVQ